MFSKVRLKVDTRDYFRKADYKSFSVLSVIGPILPLLPSSYMNSLVRFLICAMSWVTQGGLKFISHVVRKWQYFRYKITIILTKIINGVSGLGSKCILLN